ncbi:MMPL family transporter, partial [Mycolicibacterium porcinum]
MLQRLHGTADNSDSGTFHKLGGVVVRWPWLVIAFWVILAAALPPLFPSLTELSQKTPPAMLPADAPGSVAAQHMSQAFHESGSDNILLVVLSDENALDGADENVYRELVDKLRADSASVVTMQDFITTPPLRQVMTSQDGKAWLLPVPLPASVAPPPPPPILFTTPAPAPPS